MKAGNKIQDLQYTFNNFGQLTQRTDYSLKRNTDGTLSATSRNQTETFTYDVLNRLDTYKQGQMQYNLNGNITHKPDAGAYTYAQNNAPQHAVTTVSNSNGAITTEHNITYTPFNKVASIANSTDSLTFTYAANQQRIVTRLYQSGSLTQTKYFIGGNFEQIVTPSKTYNYHYIMAGDGLCAIHIQETGQANKTYYTHTDYLGSLHRITDANQLVTEEYSFDAWGQRRNPDYWNDTNWTAPEYSFTRGYTGHEHLDMFALINMNGRVYDPEIGRFLSPDPYVQMPDFTQNYNRYSYVLNNPLIYSDPSGESIITALIGSYLLTSITEGSLNPKKWAWDEGTFLSLIFGGIGGHFAAALPAANAGTTYIGAAMGDLFAGVAITGQSVGIAAGSTAVAGGMYYLWQHDYIQPDKWNLFEQGLPMQRIGESGNDAQYYHLLASMDGVSLSQNKLYNIKPIEMGTSDMLRIPYVIGQMRNNGLYSDKKYMMYEIFDYSKTNGRSWTFYNKDISINIHYFGKDDYVKYYFTDVDFHAQGGVSTNDTYIKFSTQIDKTQFPRSDINGNPINYPYSIRILIGHQSLRRSRGGGQISFKSWETFIKWVKIIDSQYK